MTCLEQQSDLLPGQSTQQQQSPQTAPFPPLMMIPAKTIHGVTVLNRIPWMTKTHEGIISMAPREALFSRPFQQSFSNQMRWGIAIHHKTNVRGWTNIKQKWAGQRPIFPAQPKGRSALGRRHKCHLPPHPPFPSIVVLLYHWGARCGGQQLTNWDHINMDVPASICKHLRATANTQKSVPASGEGPLYLLQD